MGKAKDGELALGPVAAKTIHKKKPAGGDE